ncbi:Uncharacterized protein OBRU01_18106, partial [Operophtera brumata]
MELVCHKCDLKTSSDTFVKHLESNHGDVRDHDTVEAFVRDYVTFEETLISESDGDDASIVSVASTEAPDVIPQRLDCPLCASAFSSRFRLVQHLTKHPEANLGDGISCCGDTRNENELITHLNREHKDPNRIQCKSCDHIAVDKPTSTTHIAHCHTESKSDVITNIQLGSPGPDETNQKRIPAVCPNCNRTFSNKYNMLNHMKSHAKDAKTSKFVCECGKSYSTRGNLVAHIRIAHTEELPHRCSDCGEGFPTRSTRDIHSRLHSGARPFSCAFCPLSFRSKNSQDKHQETHVPPQHECELCGKKFRRKAHLSSVQPRCAKIKLGRTYEDEPLLYRSAEPPAFEGEDLLDNDSNDDSDSAPLAELVSTDPLAALRRALRDLRDHYSERHLRSRPETSSEESGPDEDDLNPDSFDDLTRLNMRRDRFDDATRQALDAARVRADGRTYYVCIICGRRLASPHAFVHHNRIHTGERPQVCHVCGKRFRAPQGLARHIAETHERRRRRACRLCQRTFANEQNLRQHLRTHTGERPYQCNECGKRFAQSGSLHAHRRTHTLRRAFTCADCGAAFRLRAGLTRHALRHSGERPHRCACGRAFAAKHELVAHLPLHGDQTPHVCGICGAAYKLRRALRDHTRSAHPPPASSSTRLETAESDPPLDVEIPQAQRDGTASGPQRKKRMVKRHSCVTCGRILSDACNLARHVDAVHVMRRPHACAVCRRAFTRAEHLQSHMRLHTTPASLLCDKCGAACASAAALRSHRRIHTAPRYECACGARFRRSSELHAHSSVHSGDRPHVCWCGRAFRLRAQLTMHARRHGATTVDSEHGVTQLASRCVPIGDISESYHPAPTP